MLRSLLVVACGGALGGLTRHAITEAWPTPDDAFPVATLVVNTTGALVLPALLVLLAGSGRRHVLGRLLLGTGFVGAYTTFSSVMVSVDRLLASGHAGTAVTYLAVSVLAAGPAVVLGLRLGRAMRPASAA